MSAAISNPAGNPRSSLAADVMPGLTTAAVGVAKALAYELKTADVPKTKDEQLRVREVDAGRFAVLRYSGTRNADKEAQSLERLRAWMKAKDLRELSPPIYGYFDPQWTPAFLRRNEVMVRTEGGATTN